MALTKLTARRLTKLANYMNALPKSAEKHFDMTSFADHTGPDTHNFKSIISRQDLNLCGTTACALGWAATIPSFRRAGLELTYRSKFRVFELMINGEHIEFGDRPEDNITRLFPWITPDQAEYLFGGDVETKTPKQWAKRCRSFLKNA